MVLFSIGLKYIPTIKRNPTPKDSRKGSIQLEMIPLGSIHLSN